MKQDWSDLKATRDSLREHMRLLSWIRDQADRGQIQIAKSMRGTGYEIALVPKKGQQTVKVFSGGFSEAIAEMMKTHNLNSTTPNVA